MSGRSDAIDRGLRGVLAAAETFVERLGLVALAVPPALRQLDGVLGEVPVALHTRRFAGGAFAAVTVAAIVEAGGGLRAVTMIGIPGDGVLAPILGVDVVGLGGALSLVAVDLAATDPELWAGQAEPRLEQLHRALAAAVVHRRWPEFAVEVFSRRALLAGARRGHEGAVLAGVAEFIAAATDLYRAPPLGLAARRALAGERCRRWCRAERRNRREHDALARMFGAGPAGAIVDLLFGESTESAGERAPPASGE